METARPDLRPLGVGEMVDAAIRLFRTNFLTLIKISSVVLVPIAVIQLIGTVMVGPLDMASLVVVDPDMTPAEALEPLIPLYAVLGVTGLLSFLGSILVQGASITALAQVYQGEEPDWRSSLRVGGRRFLPLTISTILFSLGTAMPLLIAGALIVLLVIAIGPVGLLPGFAVGVGGLVATVILFTRWTVSPAALVTEQLGPVAALGRSFQLVRGRFWPVLGAIVLAYILYFVVNQIISVVTTVVTLAGAMGSEQVSFIPSVVGSALVSIIATPFLAAMVTIIYFDLRVRKEGYDLELMAADLERMGGHDASPPPAAGDDPFGLGSPGDR